MENLKGPTLMKSLIVFMDNFLVLLLSCHVNIVSLQIWIVLKCGVEMSMLQVPAHFFKEGLQFYKITFARSKRIPVHTLSGY